jgi:hypothetical protein
MAKPFVRRGFRSFSVHRVLLAAWKPACRLTTPRSDAESPRQNPRTSSLPLRLTTSRAPVPRYRYRATAIRAAAAYSRIHFHIADITDRDIPSRTSHFARESTLVQASDLAGCCESHCDNHDASHTRGALRSSIVALATLSNQRFACLRSLGMALKPLAYESPRLKHAH